MMMRRVLFFSLLLLAGFAADAQVSGLHIPTAKPLKAKELAAAWQYPETFCLLLTFDAGDSSYRVSDLDLLDTAYAIAFDKQSPRYYTMTIEGYARSGEEELMEARVASVYRYFTMRGHEVFPVRYAYNPIHCSCHGDTVELLRYEVPTNRQVYNCAELTDSRKVLNKNIQLEGNLLVTFKHNPTECIGGAQGCFLPQQDSTLRSYYTQLILKKGSIYAVNDTRDECPPPVEITIDEHLDCIQLMEKYFLVPHRRQIILPVGYVVLHSSFSRKGGECSQDLPDSILIRFPVTEEQTEAKLRIFAKCYTSKGPEYKSLPTKKIKGGPVLMIQAGLDATQFDTIFLARRIKPEEIYNYLFEADSPTEQGAVTIMENNEEHFYKPFRVNRKGEYEYKKAFRALLRLPQEDEESDVAPSTDFRNDGDEELE